MANYDYKGLDKRGKKVSGSLEADSEKMLRQILKQRGIYITQIGSGRKTGESLLNTEVDFQALTERITPLDVSMFTRQLATLVKARIPLADALNASVDQVDKSKFKKILVKIRSDVNEGINFAYALEQFPKVFPPLYSSMVRSGEASGTLDQVLVRLAEFSEAEIKLKQKISSAMMYPILMMIAGGGILTALFIFVIPQITQIFQDTGQELPTVTKIIIWISNALQNWFVLSIFLGILSIYGIKHYINSPNGKKRWHKLKLRLPVFGDLVLLINVSRFSRTLATLLQSGVPLLTALDITKNVLENIILQESVSNAEIAVKEGQSLALPLKRSKQFPSMLVHMVAVGERSGALEEMLGIVADSYESQVEHKVEKLTTLLEPLMIVGLGGVIAIIVMAVLMPILQMNEFIQ
jgi:general secretion pathway protein F